MTASGERRRPGRPSSPELSDLRRQQVIETALRLFAERGYRDTTLDDIARELGFTKGLVYHYFGSKAELVHHGVRASHERSLARLQSIVESDLSPAQKLYRAIDGFLVTIMVGYERFLVVLADRDEINAVLDATWGEGRRRSARGFLDAYRRIVEEGVATGEFVRTDPTMAAHFLVQGMIGVARWYRAAGRFTPDQVRDAQCTLLMRSLLAAPAGASGMAAQHVMSDGQPSVASGGAGGRRRH